MKEKKQFFIPRNYDKKFEWIPGISGWQHVAFIPIAGVDFLLWQYTHFSISNKIIGIAISLGAPWMLMGTHPERENVSLYKYFVWRFKFLNRQRKFSYRKEGFVNEVVQSKIKVNIKAKSEGIENGTGSEKVNSRLDSIKGDRKRSANHPRKQNGAVSESVSNQS